MTRRTHQRRGFTLPELIVGSVIVAMIASSVVLSLSQAIDGERRSRARQEAVRRANAGADQIARDVRAFAREEELFNARVLLFPGNLRGDSAGELLMFSTASRSAPTAGQGDGRRPAGATYEAQYRLREDTRSEGVPGTGDDPSHVLWRRVDSLPDQYVDAGGIEFPVVEGVRTLRLFAHDGDNWTDQWDTDTDGYPYAVRIEVTATSNDGRYTERAVRVVPLDRVPLPFTPALDVSGAR